MSSGTWLEVIAAKENQHRYENMLCTNSVEQSSLATPGDIVVREDEPNGRWPNTDIYSADISDRNNLAEFPICTSATQQLHLVISGNIIVGEDWQNDLDGEWASDGGLNGINKSDIYSADISDPDNPAEFSICNDSADQYFHPICGDIIVWQNYRNGNI